ncbi:MAG: FAD-dependent oxidoreductase, partial [Thermoleophilaceae bacterium]|nr:FAD-dependent oxidoreductase [Thermoleophilaceae bacterium]
MSRRYDLVVVGLGSGGIVAAEFAARIGLRVAAVERDRVGGDCLWTGCVPSKAVIASARTAQGMRTAARVGLRPVEPDIDLAAVWGRMRSVQERIAETDDNPDRFRAMGVQVFEGEARLLDGHTVEAAGTRLDTRFILLCTGSRPAIPPIDGLEEAGYLTNETLFALERPPQSLVVLGGGPIGVEMAQACNRLGIGVTLLELGPSLLQRDEPKLVEILTRRLVAEGVEVRVDTEVERVRKDGARKFVDAAAGTAVADDILVATGRRPNVGGLGVEELGIKLGDKGIGVDSRLRTSVRSVYAAGDVAGRFLFTHSAGHEAAQAVRNMFFPWHAKAVSFVPWCTFSDPELAHAGLTATEARAKYGAGKVRVHELPLERSDRARTDAEEEGMVILVTAPERLVGAHALGPAAGELIHELAFAIRQKAKLHELSE